MRNEEYINETKSKIRAIRPRTWILTFTIVIALAFYLLINVVTKQQIDVINFILVCTIQIVVYGIYFPDGELYGQTDDTFINNREAYNEKATEINQNRQVGQLRKYCKFEYEERKHRYILNELGKIGITEQDFEIFKHKSKKEIQRMEYFVSTEMSDKGVEVDKKVFFTKNKRKNLISLLFKTLPVEENYPETIISAINSDGSSAIQDGSIVYRRTAYLKRILQAVVIGGVFAYIGYTAKDGIGWTEIVSITTYLATMITTAVIAFSAGETGSRIHKSRFYVELSNFIDGFNEWNAKQPTPQQENK